MRFESEHDITLPPDFQWFLKLAGNGGAGPYYGIFKLDQWSDFIDWTTEAEKGSELLFGRLRFAGTTAGADGQVEP